MKKIGTSKSSDVKDIQKWHLRKAISALCEMNAKEIKYEFYALFKFTEHENIVRFDFREDHFVTIMDYAQFFRGIEIDTDPFNEPLKAKFAEQVNQYFKYKK